jgi:hypothetical protein
MIREFTHLITSHELISLTNDLHAILHLSVRNMSRKAKLKMGHYL